MATKQSTVDFLTDQMHGAGAVRCRKMFGEYAIYCNDKVVALVCDEELFVKPTEAGRTFADSPPEKSPYPGAKPYFAISGDKCEDGEWLSKLIRLTADEVPFPKRAKPVKTRKT